ncbi:MAG: glucan biosynthesis protein G [Phyllobacteriaceae bacterium]|nr:glucan biosynthesis protein G [Phyllobacteriaceae bacterium]
MDRRDFLTSSLASAMAFAFAGRVAAADEPAAAPAGDQPFGFAVLKDEARALAQKPWAEPTGRVPARFADLSFEQYREIRWKRDLFLWRNDKRGFALEPLPAGSVYKLAVEVYLVDGGHALPISFDRDRFDWGNTTPPEDGVVLPFSGVKLHRPTDGDRWPEFAVFQGASYFKATVRDLRYGLTARGLAVDTASPDGEEFPTFTRFYVEKPEENANSIRLYALLESKSLTGAYRITLRQGEETGTDVELTLFPRVDLGHIGLGALNSMFLYGPIGRVRQDDIRPAVHLSDGLAIKTGAGERLWRPLANPSTLQISAFGDENPLGFGLAQRARDFSDFQDLENRWELHPSAWVEPVGDWGKGSVVLVEIPSESQIHENIVAYWRPAGKIPAGQEFSAAYRLHWQASRLTPAELAWVSDSREGRGSSDARRRFALDFVGTLPQAAELRPQVTASAGKILAPIVVPNPATGGVRLGFELDPGNAPLVELRVQLTDGTRPVSETWLYRWVAA